MYTARRVTAWVTIAPPAIKHMSMCLPHKNVYEIKVCLLNDFSFRSTEYCTVNSTIV